MCHSQPLETSSIAGSQNALVATCTGGITVQCHVIGTSCTLHAMYLRHRTLTCYGDHYYHDYHYYIMVITVIVVYYHDYHIKSCAHRGTVTSYDKATGWYKIRYDDTDSEECDLAETRRILVDDSQVTTMGRGGIGANQTLHGLDFTHVTIPPSIVLRHYPSFPAEGEAGEAANNSRREDTPYASGTIPTSLLHLYYTLLSLPRRRWRSRRGLGVRVTSPSKATFRMIFSK